MEYEVFIFISMDRKEFINVLYDIVRKTVKGKVELSKAKDCSMYIECRYFHLLVEIEDISQISLVNKEYNIDVNLCISLEVYSDDEEEAVSPLLQILAKSMTIFNGEMLVLENGAIVLLKRKNNKVVVNAKLEREYFDKYKIGYIVDDKI